MKKYVVWYNPNKNTYYYKLIRSLYYERYDYIVGSQNSYGHIIVCVIPYPYEEHYTLKKRVYRSMYTFLRKKI